MTNFDMQSFCRNCGKHRRTMPFGSTDSFWDREPCHKCGDNHYGSRLIAGWKLFGVWVLPDGRKVTKDILEAEGYTGSF